MFIGPCIIVIAEE